MDNSRRPFGKVAVLKGGPSAEREVSLRSGAAVAGALRRGGWEVVEVDVAERRLDLPDGVEAVFVALHGVFGEDGGVQALLRERGLPYTGSGPEASSLCFDKVLSKQRLVESGIPTPRYEVLKAGQPRSLALPVVVKPVREGSSIGVHIVTREEDWPDALASAAGHNGEALVEDFIEGLELTVGIVGRTVLPVLEIRAPAGFYNYDAKYTKGRTEYLVPAPIPPDRAEACRQIAGRTFEVLGCSHMGRVDIRMNGKGEIFVLELNTIPGFTETSLLPKAAQAAGIEFGELCDRILRMASVH